MTQPQAQQELAKRTLRPLLQEQRQRLADDEVRTALQHCRRSAVSLADAAFGGCDQVAARRELEKLPITPALRYDREPRCIQIHVALNKLIRGYAQLLQVYSEHLQQLQHHRPLRLGEFIEALLELLEALAGHRPFPVNGGPPDTRPSKALADSLGGLLFLPIPSNTRCTAYSRLD
jgi:hypothetical protein